MHLPNCSTKTAAESNISGAVKVCLCIILRLCVRYCSERTPFEGNPSHCWAYRYEMRAREVRVRTNKKKGREREGDRANKIENTGYDGRPQNFDSAESRVDRPTTGSLTTRTALTQHHRWLRCGSVEGERCTRALCQSCRERRVHHLDIPTSPEDPP